MSFLCTTQHQQAPGNTKPRSALHTTAASALHAAANGGVAASAALAASGARTGQVKLAVLIALAVLAALVVSRHCRPTQCFHPSIWIVVPAHICLVTKRDQLDLNVEILDVAMRHKTCTR
jgi:hypothetical protein